MFKCIFNFIGLTPAKFPKSQPERSGGFEPGSASSSTIGQQEIDAFRQIDRPRTPNLGQLSSPFLPGCYQRRSISSRVQSPIMRNSSYLDQGLHFSFIRILTLYNNFEYFKQN